MAHTPKPTMPITKLPIRQVKAGLIKLFLFTAAPTIAVSALTIKTTTQAKKVKAPADARKSDIRDSFIGCSKITNLLNKLFDSFLWQPLMANG